MIKIANKIIGETEPCFIIAEAGINHNGSLSLAKKLIDAAKKAGADSIKFQAFRADELVVKNAPKADYQQKTSPKQSQYDMLKALEFGQKEFQELARYAREKKIIFLASCFDAISAEMLKGLNVPAHKLGSGEIANLSLLRLIARHHKPIILSTGMATLDEVKLALKTIRLAGNKNIVLLHCTTNYPTAYDDVNLRAIETLKKTLKLPVGYSDHTEGIAVSIAARAMGAVVIEKHFTLDQSLPGPDHRASIEPKELEDLVSSIRNIEKAFGDGIKRPQKSEAKNRLIVRRSLVAARDIAKGEIIREGMLKSKRPGTGISNSLENQIIGRIAKRDLKADTVLRWSDLR